MKLSEAIRIGAKLGPKLVGGIWSEYAEGTCALGAAAERCGLRTKYGGSILKHGDALNHLCMIFPILEEHVKHPKLGLPCRVAGIIVYLNDLEGWSREAIAEWVETIEKSLEPKIDPVVELFKDVMSTESVKAVD